VTNTCIKTYVNYKYYVYVKKFHIAKASMLS